MKHHAVTIRDLVVALIAGMLVFFAQAMLDERRDAEADRRENLRFVREQAADGKVNDVSFRSFDLTGRNLSGLKLVGADFLGADLSGADLSGSDLTDANLYGSDLSGVKMVQTTLDGATLNAATAKGAYISNSSMNRTKMAATEMRGSQWVYIPQLDQATFYGTDLTDAKMEHVDLGLAYLSDLKVYGADLSGAILPMDHGGHLKSLCYNWSTDWPKGFPKESLTSLQCQEMHQDTRDVFPRFFASTKP